MKIEFSKTPIVKFCIFFVLVFILNFSLFNNTKKIEFKGAYLGKTPPGLIPRKFDSGQLSGDLRVFDFSFSPDGNEFFFCQNIRTKEKPYPAHVIRHMKRVNNIWEGPETAFFSGKFDDFDHTFSPDGQLLFFTRFIKENKKMNNLSGFYYLKKSKAGWSNPIRIKIEGDFQNSGGYASLSKKGNIFFTSGKSGGFGSGDIYKAKFKSGSFINIKNMGSLINTKFLETDCCIASDESYILYNTIRPVHNNKPQIYISFQNKENVWTKGQSLGSVINSKNGTMGSTITADGKYLFYISRVGKERAVYWVSTDIIKKLKK